MADIEVKCEKCGKAIIVSEFADLSKILCKICKIPIRSDITSHVEPPQQKSTRSLRFKKSEAPFSQQTKDILPPTAQKPTTVLARVEKKEETDAPAFARHNIASWILFIVLAFLCAYIRYGSKTPANWLAIIKDYSWLIALAFHIMIVLKAFKDSVFQGTLCAIIPLYSFYYLFSISDDFYMRAVIGGFLFLIGKESINFYLGLITQWGQRISDWIQKGGGDI